MSRTHISRRGILKLGSAAAATACTAGVIRLANAPAMADDQQPADAEIPIGVQLYSVRGECKKDFPGVLTQLAEMGYQGVEFAGYYGRSGEELRKLLDDNGLKCCGTHTGLNSLLPDKLNETIEFNQEFGNKYLIVPSLGGKLRSVDSIKETADQFNEIAEKVEPHGMVCGFHAHGGDFRKVEGDITRWEMFFDNTDPAVAMQLDVGNCLRGGGDPYAILKKYPGRSLTVHLKEHGGERGAPVGEGEVDWQRVFELCETIGGTKWYIVEQERYQEGGPMATVRACLENIRKMRNQG